MCGAAGGRVAAAHSPIHWRCLLCSSSKFRFLAGRAFHYFDTCGGRQISSTLDHPPNLLMDHNQGLFYR
jgi:hypothetical protein